MANQPMFVPHHYRCYVTLRVNARGGKETMMEFRMSLVVTCAITSFARGSSGSMTNAFNEDIKAAVNCFISNKISP